jgi:Response regulator containing CheY-like receiver, AAA-type ATPase, and DNA-binding domains
MSNVLVVDDEAGQRKIVASILKSVGHFVYESASVDDAIQQIAENRPEVVLTDLKMPGKSGLILVEEISKHQLPPEVVVITAFGTVETAVKAMRCGAYDYLNKPLEREELLMVVERAAEKYGLRVDGIQLRMELTRQLTSGLIAESAPMRAVLEIVSKVAASDSTVLVRGESGTGKERIARLIHYQSKRGHKPMQSINCAAFPETLLESELFGYEKGAFTGAQSRRIGLIESASGSTLFLDEVADMSLSTQAKLLRVLQEKEIRRVGGTKTIPVDIRIISATNKNLEEAIKQGSFRDDLFYRLNIIPITIPPLRERNEDIKALINYFINRSGRPKTVEPEALRLLTGYNWLGNVRELEAVMERISVLSNNDVITVDDLPVELKRISEVPGKIQPWELTKEGIVFEDLERNLLMQALQKSNGIMADAAKLLGMTYRTFQYRAEKFGLKGN